MLLPPCRINLRQLTAQQAWRSAAPPANCCNEHGAAWPHGHELFYTCHKMMIEEPGRKSAMGSLTMARQEHSCCTLASCQVMEERQNIHLFTTADLTCYHRVDSFSLPAPPRQDE